MQDFAGYVLAFALLSFFYDLGWAALRLPRWIGCLSYCRIFGALR
jgi:hypothetical protein